MRMYTRTHTHPWPQAGRQAPPLPYPFSTPPPPKQAHPLTHPVPAVQAGSSSLPLRPAPGSGRCQPPAPARARAHKHARGGGGRGQTAHWCKAGARAYTVGSGRLGTQPASNKHAMRRTGPLHPPPTPPCTCPHAACQQPQQPRDQRGPSCLVPCNLPPRTRPPHATHEVHVDAGGRNLEVERQLPRLAAPPARSGVLRPSARALAGAAWPSSAVAVLRPPTGGPRGRLWAAAGARGALARTPAWRVERARERGGRKPAKQAGLVPWPMHACTCHTRARQPSPPSSSKHPSPARRAIGRNRPPPPPAHCACPSAAMQTRTAWSKPRQLPHMQCVEGRHSHAAPHPSARPPPTHPQWDGMTRLRLPARHRARSPQDLWGGGGAVGGGWGRCGRVYFFCGVCARAWW